MHLPSWPLPLDGCSGRSLVAFEVLKQRRYRLSSMHDDEYVMFAQTTPPLVPGAAVTMLGALACLVENVAWKQDAMAALWTACSHDSLPSCRVSRRHVLTILPCSSSCKPCTVLGTVYHAPVPTRKAVSTQMGSGNPLVHFCSCAAGLCCPSLRPHRRRIVRSSCVCSAKASTRTSAHQVR